MLKLHCHFKVICNNIRLSKYPIITVIIKFFFTNTQLDLADIADAYEDVRGESLERAIKADCSGDYMRMLISLVRRK